MHVTCVAIGVMNGSLEAFGSFSSLLKARLPYPSPTKGGEIAAQRLGGQTTHVCKGVGVIVSV